MLRFSSRHGRRFLLIAGIRWRRSARGATLLINSFRNGSKSASCVCKASESFQRKNGIVRALSRQANATASQVQRTIVRLPQRRRTQRRSIINLYCQVNIIVNLNRKIFSILTFRINVLKRIDAEIDFCSSPSSSLQLDSSLRPRDGGHCFCVIVQRSASFDCHFRAIETSKRFPINRI